MIADFIRILRAADIQVSPAEAIDAAAVIDEIGFTERHLLKYALGHTLAKTESEKHSFDECFDVYFQSPDFAAEGGVDGATKTQEGGAQEGAEQGESQEGDSQEGQPSDANPNPNPSGDVKNGAVKSGDAAAATDGDDDAPEEKRAGVFGRYAAR